MAAVESGLPEIQQEPSEAPQIGIENEVAGIVHEDERRQSPADRCISIEEMLRHPDQDVVWPGQSASIRRIPQYVKDGKDKDYEPRIVSLGPYHHGKKHLRPMDPQKFRGLHRIRTRSQLEMDSYLNSVKDVEEIARSCYDEKISMNSDDFALMMVADGCFVLELFLGFALKFQTLGYDWSDHIFSMGGPMRTIQQDMILLENQIPLFILKQLFPLCILNLSLGNRYDNLNQNELLAELALNFLDPLRATIVPMNHTTDFPRWPSDQKDIPGSLHCLALFWLSLWPERIFKLHNSSPETRQKLHNSSPETRQEMNQCVTDLWKAVIEFSMTDLWKAGIEFSVTEMNSFTDIRFEKWTLKIPQFLIQDGTRSLFLNLIAFERFHSRHKRFVSSYVIFMNNLIKSPEDFEYLCRRKVIKHSLVNNAKAAAFFNQLCLGVYLDLNDHYLAGLWKDLNVFCNPNSGEAGLMLKFCAWRARLKHRCIDWASTFKQNYFSNPWSFISLIAACVLLVLTCIQTFYTAYGYHRPLKEG